MDDEFFMEKALIEAKKALKRGDWPIGCVIVLDNKIISKTSNQVYSKNDKLAHAEMLALIKVQSVLLENPGKTILYITYEPCPMCFGACILTRIKKVVSGINLDESGAMHFRKNLPLLFKQDKFRVDFKCGVLSDQCYQVFIKGKPTKKLTIHKSNQPR